MIQRDFTRTEKDDFVLNVQSRLDSTHDALEIFHAGILLGWKIISRFE